MASSLSNFTDNLAEGIYKTKCTLGCLINGEDQHKRGSEIFVNLNKRGVGKNPLILVMDEKRDINI